jgi:branched-chain amino acid transport system permease protein
MSDDALGRVKLEQRRESAGRDLARNWVHVTSPATCILVITVLGLMLASYGQYVLAISLVSAIIGAALTLLVGFARCITLASAAMMAVGAYGSTLLVHHLGLPYLPSVVLATVFGAIAGLVLAIPGTRFRSHNLAMVTLVFQAVLIILIRESKALTGGAEGMHVPAPVILGAEIATDSGFLMLIGGGATAAVLAMTVILQGRFGKNMRAVAQNEIAAETYGIGVKAYLTAAFVLSSSIIAFAGALAAPRIRIIDPDSFGILASVFMLAYPIIGGMTSIWAGIIGGGALRLLPEVLRPVADYQEFIFSALVIVVVLFFPGGLVQLMTRAWRLVSRGGLLAAQEKPATGSFGAAGFRTISAALESHAGQVGTAEVVPALQIQNVSRAFGALKAVDEVTLTVEAGTLHGIIGPNGAGKTSLFNIITGFLAADSGEISCFGRPLLGQPISGRIRMGMTRTFQNVALFPELSCRDNAIIGLGSNDVISALRHTVTDLAGTVGSRRHFAAADAALEAVGLSEFRFRKAGSLSLGDQRRLELARAIISNPRLILLDEPVSGLSQAETEQLRALLLAINSERKAAMLLIEHNVGFVTSLCPRVTIMGGGRVIAEGEAHSTINLPEVRELYFGERARK